MGKTMDFLNSLFSRPKKRVRLLDDGAFIDLVRTKAKSGSRFLDRTVRIGPNHVHVYITHKDGTVTDLGVSKNLLTNIGRDWMSQALSQVITGVVQNAPATSTTTSTTITGTGSTWTASNLASPQLGLAGSRVVVPVTAVTTAPVYGNIVSNTTSIITVDKWWTAAGGTGTTPSNTASFIVIPGTSAVFMALTQNGGAASAADTVLTSEITSGGCGRQVCTYAHSMGAATSAIASVFTVTSTFAAIVKMGLFTALTAAGADPMIFEDTFTSASVISGDTLTVTDTITYSG